jgi:hypothetical protein
LPDWVVNHDALPVEKTDSAKIDPQNMASPSLTTIETPEVIVTKISTPFDVRSKKKGKHSITIIVDLDTPLRTMRPA